MANKPNVLFMMSDDIGISNLSCYTDGLMGYRTPNIDRIANEGVKFTDSYGEQSCTAGRAAFITGQSPYRTGLSKVGMPGSDFGILPGTLSIAYAFKNLGYRTGQFGKNHFGDQDQHLPTNHGFDEFKGILYHLNAMEEPEFPDYPKDSDFPGFSEKFGPRGIVHSYADGRVKQHGPLTSEMMQTIDDDFGAETRRFIKEAVDADEPFFVWHNTTHMHYRTHTKPDSIGQAGRWQSRYHDTMIDHDKNIGELLDYLDELGIADNTIVVYTTDNGPHLNQLPDAAMTPFRGEKNTNWEGSYRIPMLARWKGHWMENVTLNGIVSLYDWFPTLLAACGDTDIKERLLAGTNLDGEEFKAHLDGYDLNDYLAGKTDESPRNEFFYWTDDGDLACLRFDNWKFVFIEQEYPGTYFVWANPFTVLRAPKFFNLRIDPYERMDITSNSYWLWYNEHQFLIVPAVTYVSEHLKTFAEFPPMQKAATFTIDQALEKLQKSSFSS